MAKLPAFLVVRTSQRRTIYAAAAALSTARPSRIRRFHHSDACLVIVCCA
jgi:hypothetical protein